MSRLTKRENGELYYRQGENYAWSKPINKGNVKYPTLSKLAHYEDLEDQGRLIELPCLPNEEVWESHKRFGTHKTMYASREAIVGAIEAGYAIGYTKEAAEAKLGGTK